MTLKNINEEVGVIKAHLEQDQPDMEFIVRHAEALLQLAHELAAHGRYESATRFDGVHAHDRQP